MSIAADHAYHVQYNMVTVSSDRIRSIYADAFDIDVHKVKALGCPRTDAFYDEKLMDETKQKVYAGTSGIQRPLCYCICTDIS